tara:strand:+ start:279 stop:386 length:108 start_codon:yes stop_codon:yes gene_type:complete
MDDNPKPQETPQEATSEKERLEELRRWFETQSDCV